MIGPHGTAGPPPGLSPRTAALVFAAYFCVGALSLSLLHSAIEALIPFWLPSGIAVAMQATAARSQRWRLALVQLFLEFWVEQLFGAVASVPLHLGYAAAVAAESWLGGALLARALGGPPRLDHVREAVALAGTAVLAPAALSLPAATLQSALLREPFGAAALDWIAGDTIGVVVMAPVVLLTLQRAWPRLDRGQAALASGLGLAIVGVVGLLFFAPLAPGSPLVPLAFAVFPLFMAAALVFGAPGAAASALLLCLLVAGGTHLGRGPFGGMGWSAFSRQLLSQTFVLLLALSALVVGSLTTQTRAASRKLGDALVALRDSTSRLQALFETAPDAIAVSDTAGRLLAFNQGWAALFRRVTGGVPAAGLHVEELGARLPAAWRSPLAEAWEAGADGARSVKLLEAAEAGAASGSYELTAAPVRDPAGRVIGVSLHARDVDAARAEHERRARAERLESVGRLAGGVAHDFNNLLTVILGHADAMKADLPEGELRQAAEEIEGAAARAAALTAQLLQFARREPVEPRAIDLNEKVRSLETMLRRLLGEHVRVAAVLSPAPLGVLVDPGRIDQVLMNLVVNARDAMPRGGTVTLRTYRRELDPGEARLHEVGPGPVAVLEVADTGHGMPPEVLARLFEPFFTTKEKGRGTGLGLATTEGIVRQAGGLIQVESAVGVGTTFRILLPLREGPIAAAHPPAAPRQAGGEETVLLVEDEAAIRALSARYLRQAGYQVLEAARGDTAMAVASAHEGAIDLLLTDVVLPGVSGRDLAAALAGTRPGLRVLYISGYTDDIIAAQGVVAAGTDLLSKPYTSARLLERVRAALDRAPPGQLPAAVPS